MISTMDNRYLKTERPFGRWLIAQVDHEGPLGDLARRRRQTGNFPGTALQQMVKRAKAQLPSQRRSLPYGGDV